MSKFFRKTLSGILSLAMAASCAALPITAGAVEPESWKFDFGSADNVAAGYIGVSADDQYSAAVGYGFLGLENGFALDNREDGWDMTQGYDLVLVNGARDNVATADDDFVATTTRTEKEQDYNSPIRFSMRVDTNTYYKVKVTLQRADVSKEAKVSLFTEKRHQHLLNEPIPEEGLVYETSVYVHNNWSKNTGEYTDQQLSVAAAGDNVAVSSIEIEKTDQGKTLWILGDSTVCQQTASIPYFPLDHCQGVGSALAKYISSDWAIVNEAESGLSASASVNHFNNMKNDIKAGDVVWFEFGHNDDKITNDPATNGYLTNLESFYNTVTEAGASFIVAAPIQRCTAGQFDKTQAEGEKWSASLAQYGAAASEFVEAQIAAGKTNIAYIDLNSGSLAVLNALQTEIDTQRADKGLASLDELSLRYYYYTSKYAGYDNNERTHPNDYGADVFAKAAVDEAKEKIEAAEAADATASQTAQAAVLAQIFSDTRTAEAVHVPAEVVQDGAAPNSYYPTQLAKVVKYDYPLIVNSVTFTEDNKPSKMTVKQVASDLTFSYGKGIIEIFDKEGNPKGSVTTSDNVDVTAAETQEITFDDTNIVFDAAAGDTFNAYVKLVDADTFEVQDTVISTTYTQNDMIDVKEYLLQGAIGTENKEDFSSYNLAEGDTIIGQNGWTNPGGESFVYAEENGVTYAHCETTGSATYYPEKKFTAVSSGQLYCRMDVRYISGTYCLYFTDGTALNNWPAGRIMPVQIKTEDGEVKVFLDGTAVATINSGEWVTFALIIDMDYGTYSLSLNGQTYTADFAAYQSMDSILTPSNLSLIAFQNDKSTNEYDVTNIVLATLNTQELPDKTFTAVSEDDSKGSVSIKNGEEAVEGNTLTAKMNTIVTAVAEPADGYEFKDWKNTETDEVVSYSTSYELRLHDDISVTAEFDTAVVDPITYSYKEQFSSLSTGTLATNGWTSTNAQTMLTVEQDAEHGNYLQFAPGNQNSRGMVKSFGVDLTSEYVVEMDLALTAGSGNAQNTTFSVINTAASNAINDSADNYIFSIDTTNSTEWTINGGTDTVTIPKGEWVHVTLVVGDDGSEVRCIITDGSKTLYDGTIAAVGGTALKGIHFRAGRYNAVGLLDNVRVYTADQYVEPTPAPTEEPTAAPTDSPTPAPTDAPTDAPATDTPATDAPATDAPATDTPATDAPATDTPATDTPATDAPATDTPATAAPTATAVPVQKTKTSITVSAPVIGYKYALKDTNGNVVAEIEPTADNPEVTFENLTKGTTYTLEVTDSATNEVVSTTSVKTRTSTSSGGGGSAVISAPKPTATASPSATADPSATAAPAATAVPADKDSFILTIDKKEASVWGEEKVNDAAPVIVNDRTMLPARFVAEGLGAKVEWNQAEQKVTITKDDTVIIITIGAETALVNGKEQKLDAPAYVTDDTYRTYTPVRFISENLGYNVEWNQDTQQVIITKPEE